MTERNRSREAVRHADPADQLRADLNTIADLWDDLLEAQLGGAAELDPGPVTGTREYGVKVGFQAIQIERDVVGAARFVARVIADETSAAPPNPTRDLPTALRWIAQWRADWLARHPDLGPDLVSEWHAHRWRVHDTVYAERTRVIKVGVPCPEHTDLDPAGERLPCPGALTITLDPRSDLMPDLACDQDPTHRISPEEWFRAARRGGYEAARIGELLQERRA